MDRSIPLNLKVMETIRKETLKVDIILKMLTLLFFAEEKRLRVML